MKASMKRFCALGLSTALMMAALAGCGGGSAKTDGGSDSAASGDTIKIKLASMNGEDHASGNA